MDLRPAIYGLSLLLLAGMAHGDTIGIFQEGAPLADVTLPTLDGQLTNIRSFVGKKTVLHVFASW